MEPRLVYWIFPILFVGSMALMLLAARSATRRATRNLRIFADRLGLTLIEYPPVLGYFPRTPTVEGTGAASRSGCLRLPPAAASRAKPGQPSVCRPGSVR
jgi:hypothetical protein